MTAPGDELTRRGRRWVVDEVERQPDFSLRATVPGERTGPLRALLRKTWDDRAPREWVPVAELEARGWRAA